MRLKYRGRILTFRTHDPDQQPYLNKTSINGLGLLDGKKKTKLVMNPNLTPAGNPSRRVSLEFERHWYFRDDAELHRDAFASEDSQPLLFYRVDQN